MLSTSTVEGYDLIPATAAQAPAETAGIAWRHY